MRVEIRADGAHISGYVNATGKTSQPVITPRGKVVETIEPGAIERAIERAKNITVTVDHETHVYASVEAHTLKLYEDYIGLYADALITDPEVVEHGRNGDIRGWSFGMFNVVDDMEERAGQLPLRHVKDLDLDHITLVINKTPCYSATSVEVRAEGEIELETRTTEQKTQITEEKPPFFDNSAYRARVEATKKQNGGKK